MDFFETICETGSLINEYYVFKLEYTPKTYKFRSGQLNKMVSYSKGLKHGEAPKNMMLVGSCATDKTK
jgi:Cdc6-like AAA superfamily ATPase